MERFDPNKKLAANREWVSRYVSGEKPYPIHLEVDPANPCSLDCSYCVWREYRDLEGPSHAKLPRDVLLRLVGEASELGVKSITWTGGGEPLLNSATVEAINMSHRLGIKNGMFTTAVPLVSKVAENLLGTLSWVRFHIDGGNLNSYADSHRVSPKVFGNVTKNIRYYAAINKGEKDKASLGVGTVAIPDKINEIGDLARLSRDLGLDFFQYKHDITQMKDSSYLAWWNEVVVPMMTVLGLEIESENFKLHYSKGINYSTPDETPKCHIHFADMAILATGDVSFCKSTRDQPRMHLGNVLNNSLKEILDGSRHKLINDWVTPQNCGVFPCPLRDANTTLGKVLEAGDISKLGPVKQIDHPEFL